MVFQATFAGLILVFGTYLLVNPKGAINLQIKFYEKINWRMEPLSWQKEIRNTRIMGGLAIVLGILIFVLAMRR